ncbi:MocR-like pyridoxine biosynthesis transcription factor PdxR [Granulosicoccus sp. 3-233]|uniref:MocR-like pyridoxine biosynthesis transcription factor PdxR n=1 Tax=Granulosicoccus sp. 3-233 TaxID=3417969 RepID=UPI003D332A54
MVRTHEKPMWHQLIKLDSGSGQSLQAQLRQALVKAILDGRIPVNVPLPSSRELSRQLSVARNTVVLAYQHLIDENYLQSHERRGYFVNPDILDGRVETPRPDPSPGKRVGFRDLSAERGPDVVLDLLDQRSINRPLEWRRYEYPFIYGQADASLFPVNDWREACRLSLRVDAISRWTQDRVDHDDELLVEQIHTRVLPRRGVWAEKDEILITSGAQNALYLIAQLLLDKDSTVGIEDPCYVDARNIFSLCTRHRELFPVGERGVETDERLSRCKMIYVTPSHQCPTTTTMPLEVRKSLLEQAARHDVTIVEDDYESELNFVGKPTPALKSLDSEHRVIYVGSLSKTLAPGLRVGFMVGPKKFIQQARALRRLMYRHPPSNNQRTVAHFLSLGHHDSALLRLSQSFKARWQIMDEALKRHDVFSSLKPTFGGSAFWVQLPESVSARELEVLAANNGIIINAGDHYFASREGPGNFCRLGFSSIPEDRIEAGIDKLAGLVRSLAEDGRQRPYSS